MTNPTGVLYLIEAFRRSKAMFAAVKMGVFDFLEKAPASAAAVAEHTSSNLDAMERLLESCAGLNLLVKKGDDFSNTPEASAYLCRDSKTAMTGYILYSNDVLYKMWGNLEDAVNEGTNRWQQTFGSTGPLFDSFFPTEEALRTFIMGMHGFGVLSSPSVVKAFDLSGFKRMVDLGGATGHLTVAACEEYPHLQGVVFDFAKVLKIAREQIVKSRARRRIECVPGDFFTDELPEADLYALGRILHDWAPDKIDLLLRKIYGRLQSGGALLIAERLLDDNKIGPVPAQMQSLNMLVCTDGKERSLAEYRELLTGVGFSSVEGVRTGKPADAILARK
jgi:acetylserotonin O-methyltransferase